MQATTGWAVLWHRKTDQWRSQAAPFRAVKGTTPRLTRGCRVWVPSLHIWTPRPCDRWLQTSSLYRKEAPVKSPQAPSVHASLGTSLQLCHQLQARCPNSCRRCPLTSSNYYTTTRHRVWERQLACPVTVQTSATEWDQTGDSSRLHTNAAQGHHHQRMAQQEIPLCITPYFDYRDELTVQHGIVLREERMVIPTSMRKDKVHAGHSGINSCLRRARELIFRPRMSSKIRQYIESCDICASHGTKQSPEPLNMHKVPNRPGGGGGGESWHRHFHNQRPN